MLANEPPTRAIATAPPAFGAHSGVLPSQRVREQQPDAGDRPDCGANSSADAPLYPAQFASGRQWTSVSPLSSRFQPLSRGSPHQPPLQRGQSPPPRQSSDNLRQT